MPHKLRANVYPKPLIDGSSRAYSIKSYNTMPAKALMTLVLCLFSAVFALPASLSERLTTLEQQVKVHELEQRVKALNVKRDAVDEKFWVDFSKWFGE